MVRSGYQAVWGHYGSMRSGLEMFFMKSAPRLPNLRMPTSKIRPAFRPQELLGVDASEDVNKRRNNAGPAGLAIRPNAGAVVPAAS
jgi:hypothetical protein